MLSVDVYNTSELVIFSSSGVSRVGLIRKLVAVLESTEKLPVYQYDSPGCSFGMQVL